MRTSLNGKARDKETFNITTGMTEEGKREIRRRRVSAEEYATAPSMFIPQLLHTNASRLFICQQASEVTQRRSSSSSVPLYYTCSGLALLYDITRRRGAPSRPVPSAHTPNTQ